MQILLERWACLTNHPSSRPSEGVRVTTEGCHTKRKRCRLENGVSLFFFRKGIMENHSSESQLWCELWAHIFFMLVGIFIGLPFLKNLPLDQSQWTEVRCCKADCLTDIDGEIGPCHDVTIGEHQIYKVPGCGFCDVWESTEYLIGGNQQENDVNVMKNHQCRGGRHQIDQKKSLGTSLTGKVMFLSRKVFL